MKVGVGLLLLTAIGLGLYLAWQYLGLDDLAQRETAIHAWVDDHRWQSYLIALGLYVLLAGLSVPIGGPLSLVYGWLLGLLPALVIVSFASTAGATIAFLVSRYLFRDLVERILGDRLATIQERLDREGPFALFTLRMIPAVPFWVINLVMGLTRMRVWTFWWVSQLGMLPGTAVYVWAGSQVPTLREIADGKKAILSWPLIAALIALAVFPWIVRGLFALGRRLRSG